MSDTHTGAGYRGNFGENEVNWGGYRNADIAASSHMSYPSLKTLTPRYQPGTAVDGDYYIVGTGNGWGQFPVDPSNINASRSTVGHIAVRDLSRWYYHRVRRGLIVHAQNTNRLYLYNGSAWVDLVGSAETPQDFNYNSLTNKPAAYSPPDPMWYKAWRDSNTNISNNSLLGSLSTSTSTSSTSSSKIFNTVGQCISPGFYDIRYQVQANKLSAIYGKLDIQIKVGNTIIAESTTAGGTNLNNSPWTYFTQCITQLNQNDFVSFDQVVNNTSLFQAIGGEAKTFASIHRIR